MRKTATEIADQVLFKVGYAPDAPPGLPALLAGGAGIGTGVGALSGTLQSAGDIIRSIQLAGKIPEQTEARRQIRDLLRDIRKQVPGADRFSDRTLIKKLLETEQTPQLNYALRRGYEEGLAGLSRSTKTLKALKGKILKNIAKKSLIGTGIGLGGGLLGATALGHFD